MGVLDRALDRSIAFSFDQTGYRRHARDFEPLTPWTGEVLLTGGTRGIGAAAVDALRGLGATVTVWARSSKPAVDLGDLDAVRDAAEGVEKPLSAVVLNAGAMPLSRTLTAQGHELVWASQVLGHLLLLRILRRREKLLPGARVIWVASGGLYSAQLDLRDLTRAERYQRHSVYANAKRAQLILCQQLAEQWPEVHMSCMHPGWVDTGAVRHSMPVFYRITRPILRTPAQGADTIVWLVTTPSPGRSGAFWFDRRVQPAHLLRRTESRPGDEARLGALVFGATDAWAGGE